MKLLQLLKLFKIDIHNVLHIRFICTKSGNTSKCFYRFTILTFLNYNWKIYYYNMYFYFSNFERNPGLRFILSILFYSSPKKMLKSHRTHFSFSISFLMNLCIRLLLVLPMTHFMTACTKLRNGLRDLLNNLEQNWYIFLWMEDNKAPFQGVL